MRTVSQTGVYKNQTHNTHTVHIRKNSQGGSAVTLDILGLTAKLRPVKDSRTEPHRLVFAQHHTLVAER